MTRTALALLAVVIAVCGSGRSGEGGPPARALATITLGIAPDPRYTCFSDAAKAHEYTSYGLNVTLVSTPADEMVGSVNDGKVDIAAVDVSSVVLTAPTSPDLRLVALDVTSSDYVKLWARDGVSSSPVAGRLGLIPDGPEQAAAAHLVSEEPGLKVVSTAAGTLAEALRSKSIDYGLAAGTGTDLLAAGARVVGPSNEFGYQYQQGLVTQDSWLSSHTDAVRHLTEALAVACQKIGPASVANASATLTFGIRAPSQADIDNYTMELAWRTGVETTAASAIEALVRQDLVSNTNTLNPGCDCQWLPSPSASSP